MPPETIWVTPVQMPPGSHQVSDSGHQPGAGGFSIQSTPQATRMTTPSTEQRDPGPGLDAFCGTHQGPELDRLDAPLGPLVLLRQERETGEDAEETGAGQEHRGHSEHEQQPAEPLEHDPLRSPRHGSTLPGRADSIRNLVMMSGAARLLVMSAQPVSGVVCQLLTVRRLAPGRPVDVEVEFSYDPADPYAVAIVFEAGLPTVRRELARSSLARGITEPVGGAHLSLWPSLTAAGRAVVVLSMVSPDGDLLCEIRTNQLHRFLTRTFALVPVGTESDHLDLDRVVERLLTSDAQ